VELAVGDDALGAIFAEPDVGGAVAAIGVCVAVECIDGDVCLGTEEPLVVDTVPDEDSSPGL
jgi:hypothetical protein